jgi:hypothetical protein
MKELWLQEKRRLLNSIQTIAKLKEQKNQAASACSYHLLFSDDNGDDPYRYIIALHNRSTSKTTMLGATRAPHVLARTVKALKSIEPSAAPSALAYQEARTALGETFGTKKAQAAIRARERNKIDVSAMQGVMEHVVEGIERAAEALPTKGAF